MNTLKRTLLASALALLSLPVMADSAHPKIGFSIDDLRLERWSRDRDYFVAAAEKLDAKVFVQSADANEQKQISQIENLISRGVDVIVIVPFNATGADAKPMGDIAAACKKQGLWPFVHFNRIHVVPPCTVSPSEVREGIAIIDEALTLADAHYEG